jgi:hypothetical protein
MSELGDEMRESTMAAQEQRLRQDAFLEERRRLRQFESARTKSRAELRLIAAGAQLAIIAVVFAACPSRPSMEWYWIAAAVMALFWGIDHLSSVSVVAEETARLAREHAQLSIELAEMEKLLHEIRKDLHVMPQIFEERLRRRDR